MSQLFYLASPYSHPDQFVRAMRYRQALSATGHLMKQGQFVFSPIVHSHPIAVWENLATDWEYWKELDELMLSCCNSLTVLTLDGWQGSRGIAAEIKLAHALSMPVSYMSYERGTYVIKGSAP